MIQKDDSVGGALSNRSDGWLAFTSQPCRKQWADPRKSVLRQSSAPTKIAPLEEEMWP